MNLVVCLCSRGLMFSRTLESIIRNIEQAGLSSVSLGTDWDMIQSHSLPIPDAQNFVISEAIKLHDPDFIWMVEEDVEPPTDCLRKMLAAICARNCEVVTAWYNLAGKTRSYTEHSGTLLYSGLGCVLIRSEVFELLEKPWFTSRFSYLFEDGIERRTIDPGNYGRHDVHFCRSVINSGMRIELLNVQCSHLYVKEFGKPMTNNGCHMIGER